ncbi:unnamed protein product [Mycena citricolor]|uniref:D-arabinono-1,4-lactone oxidase n=1 Tax=Mycena citricolor TaxID=2018698 RepID=A0AAD2HBC8_9AGAR|nr:unnamed protein product [Mycena citricolor]CAK5271464.1 unnamed protein product [Mycena citricolor]
MFPPSPPASAPSAENVKMESETSDVSSLSRAQLVAALEPISSTRPSWSNWAQTFHCTPSARFAPRTVHECRLALELARRDGRVLRPVGIGHSPSDLACTRDYMLDMTRMNRVLEINAASSYVRAEAGITLDAIHSALGPHGLAMRNLGSISDQTLAGIVTTCTHGSGVDFGVMSTHVIALSLLTPSLSLVHLSPRDPDPKIRDLFTATICGLGSTGVIIDITLEVEPAFNLRDEHTLRPFGEVIDELDELKGKGEHVRLWWFPAVGQVKCSVADRTKEPRRLPFSGWTAWFWDAVIGFHAIQTMLVFSRFRVFSDAAPIAPSQSPKTSRLFSALLWGPRHVLAPLHHFTKNAHIYACRLALWMGGKHSVTVNRSDLVFNIECRYPQHTTEWAVPSANAKACLLELNQWLEEQRVTDGPSSRPHFPIEIRFSKADDLWLSPSNGVETCWIGVVVFKPYNLPVRYQNLFSAFERIMEAHSGRPHWAKAHHLTPQTTQAMYPQLGKFLAVLRGADPEGILRNEYVERHLLSRDHPEAFWGREYKLRNGPPRLSRPWLARSDWRHDWRIPPPPSHVAQLKADRAARVDWTIADQSLPSSDSESDAETLAELDVPQCAKY